MPSQFETINAKLDQIIDILETLSKIWNKVIQDLDYFDLELESEADGDHSEGMDTTDSEGSGNRSPRSRHTYKTLDGGDGVISSNDLDQKVNDIIALSDEMGHPWQLYEGQDGTIRLMASNEAIAEWNNRHPGTMG